MRVRATERGYFGGRLIEPGDEFECADDAFADASTDGGWMMALEAKKPAKKGKAAKEDQVSDDDLIDQAKELTGRDDIATVEEAREIIAAAGGL